MHRDYYWEFIEEADLLLNKFIIEANRIEANAFVLNNVNLEKAILNYLWCRLFFLESRNTYNELRLSGIDRNTASDNIWNTLLFSYLPQRINKLLPPIKKWEKTESGYQTDLKGLNNTLFFFCLNNRQLNYYLPIINQLKEPTVVFSSFSIPENIFQNDLITVVEFKIVSEEVCFRNEYLERKFERIYEYCNTFSMFLEILQPKLIVFLEGCHDETETIAAIAKKMNIKTVCIQQGWPSLVQQTRFRNMRYDYYLTWGSTFNTLWAKYNPFPEFIDVGYLYPVIKIDKTVITFFLQAPVIILNFEYFNEIIELIVYCANTFKESFFCIKEHPEFSLSQTQKNMLLTHENVKFVTNMPLAEVFGITKISVGVFSSTIMESIIHDAIPFIFDPSSTQSYYPNLEKMNIGIQGKSLLEAKEKMTKILKNEDFAMELLSKQIELKPLYFKAQGDSAVNNVIKTIHLILSE